jgi:tetratricopeptide (TPR) repeat protein
MSIPSDPSASREPRVLHLDQLDDIAVAGVRFRPVRRALGITAFGINAYTADAGQRVIEEHDETGAGAGGHEELYLVVAGGATFELAGRKVEATAGSLVFVPDPATRRGAVATADGTTIIVIGGRPGAGLPTSPFEHWFAAEPAVAAGRYAEAEQIVLAGLDEHPGHPDMHYQLACYTALDGRLDEAMEHLRVALETDPSLAKWARGDDDLAALRDRPDWPA